METLPPKQADREPASPPHGWTRSRIRREPGNTPCFHLKSGAMSSYLPQQLPPCLFHLLSSVFTSLPSLHISLCLVSLAFISFSGYNWKTWLFRIILLQFISFILQIQHITFCKVLQHPLYLFLYFLKNYTKYMLIFRKFY